ncbi:hypothetical protein CR513_55832, partial [Mucuna pruriens]
MYKIIYANCDRRNGRHIAANVVNVPAQINNIPMLNGTNFKSQSAIKFLEEIEQFFAKNEKTETSNLLVKLITMKYKGKGNIKEYIMEITTKLKSFKLEIVEELLVHLVLISLPAYFGEFKVIYNTQKDK